MLHNIITEAKAEARSVGVCALLSLFRSSFFPCVFLLQRCLERVWLIIQLAGASANIRHRLIYFNLPATSLSLDGRTLCLGLLQRLQLPFLVFPCRKFPSPRLFPWTSSTPFCLRQATCQFPELLGFRLGLSLHFGIQLQTDSTAR